MKLLERLDAKLAAAGLSEDDRLLWRTTIRSMPFNKQEVFVFILEKLEKKDVIFFNDNLKGKIDAMMKMDADAVHGILEKEKTYLSKD